MAAEMQKNYIQRAQRESQGRQRGPSHGQRDNNRQPQPQARQPDQQRQQRNQAAAPNLIQAGSSQNEFHDVPLGTDEEEFKMRRSNQKGIKKSAEAREQQGFFSRLFGCCTSKKAASGEN